MTGSALAKGQIAFSPAFLKRGWVFRIPDFFWGASLPVSQLSTGARVSVSHVLSPTCPQSTLPQDSGLLVLTNALKTTWGFGTSSPLYIPGFQRIFIVFNSAVQCFVTGGLFRIPSPQDCWELFVLLNPSHLEGLNSKVASLCKSLPYFFRNETFLL